MRSLPLGILLAAGLLVPASAATAKSNCGVYHNGFETRIAAYNLSCTKARAVVKAWDKKSVPGNPGTKTVGTYHCISTATDSEHVFVRCTNVRAKSHKVTFYAGP